MSDEAAASEVMVPNYLQAEIVRWFEQIKALDPNEPDKAKRRERLEEIAIKSAYLQGEFMAVMYMALHVIKREGLWRTALDHEGHPYRRREDYDTDMMEHIQGVSVRTVNARQAQMDLFDALEVSTDDQISLLANKPSVSERALSVVDVVYNPDTNEPMISIDYTHRREIEMALDLDHGQCGGDKELAQQFLSALAGLPHGDAGARVSRVTKEWKRRIRYLPQEKVLELTVFQVGKGNRRRNSQSVRFAYVGGELRDAEIQRWLNGLIS